MVALAPPLHYASAPPRNTPSQPQHPPREAPPSALPDLDLFRETIRKNDLQVLLDLFARLRAPTPPS
ncbi:MAG: hypothetical protein IKQ15_06655, partial [Kiritimatiellae bacterium]|nr:hypothetical protein [Kiritimatiellia bacterium]